mgnify:CR=1 FL=1
MSEDDIPEIAQMEFDYFGVPWKEASIGHYMEQDNTLFIVAKHMEQGKPGTWQVAGYIALMSILNESELISIAVHEDYRNLGIARELLDIAYDMLKKRGSDLIHLEVRESNEAAIRLYESEGFEKDGVRKGYYDKPKEDAVLYTKVL